MEPMPKHVTRDEVERLDAMPPRERMAVLRHVSACAECAALAPNVNADAAGVRAFLAAELTDPRPHLDPDTELFPYIDGTLPPFALEIVEAHLDDCPVCREEVADLVALRDGMHRPVVVGPRRRFATAAAIVLAIVAASILLLMTRDDPAPAPPPVVQTNPAAPATATTATSAAPIRTATYANPEWQRLVDEARATGTLPPSPSLGLPDAGAEVVRGDTASGAPVRVQPAGRAVEETRPQLTWPAPKDSTSIVSIFDGEREVARSARLRTTRWTANVELARGRTYTWQVEIIATDGTRTIVPSPPDPPAMFHVIGERPHEELARARAQHPNDHLLLAVLYARSGLRDEARVHWRQTDLPPVP